MTPLSTPDRRRNVVHVLSVFEARQWRLPVVLVCGMVEKQFPRYYSQDPIFPDEARHQLRRAGFRVRTAAEKESEESLLFEIARTRATSRLIFTYPETDDRGNETLPSLFLEGERSAPSIPGQAKQAQAAIPHPPCPIPASEASLQPHPPSPIPQPREQSELVSPTALESFLQCPFQFFGRHTLRLKSAPPPADLRFDPLSQGSLIHKVLSEWHREEQPLEAVFERVFESFCREKSIPAGYRTEALRIQMLDDLRHFDAAGLAGTPETKTEIPFQWDAGGGLTIRGRIDRIDILDDGRAVVIDYKYASAARVRDRVREGRVLQAPLYVMACEHALGHKVAGMFYLGLKKEIKRAGWGVWQGKPGEPITPEWLEASLATARQAMEAIRAGRIAPDPADTDECEFCELRGVCRYV